MTPEMDYLTPSTSHSRLVANWPPWIDSSNSLRGLTTTKTPGTDRTCSEPRAYLRTCISGRWRRERSPQYRYSTKGRTAFVRQLAWRDWYAHLLWEVPSLAHAPLRPDLMEMGWQNDPADIEDGRRV